MRDINPNRAVAATFIAALLGGGVFAMNYALNTWSTEGLSTTYLKNVCSLWIWASLFWLLGILIFAGPFWALLHRCNKREARHAILLGAALGFVIWFISYERIKPTLPR